MLYELSGGSYRDETYIYHLRMSHPKLGKIILIVTDKHIFLRKGEGEYGKIWDEKLSGDSSTTPSTTRLTGYRYQSETCGDEW